MTPGKPTLARIAKFTTFPEIENATNHIFNDAQLTLSGHRKLVMLLRRIQVRAVTIGFEEMFTLHFTKLVSKIFKQKKGVNSADRIAKFCSNFVAVLMKEEEENPTVRPASSDSGDEVPEDGISSEFADNLIRFLLRGIESKSKDVRYRVVQLLAYLVIYITEIEEQLFRALHFSLNRRLHDKESMVRIQAVVAISRFQIFDEIGEGQSSKASDSIIHAMNNDDSPEVRRAALLNMSKIVSATPELVKRARDVNVINRRLVYSRVSRDLPCLMDLEPKLREDLLKWGIHDRDESVKSAAITMLSKHWLGQCQDDILELLEALHVVESDVAASAIQLLFEHRRDKFEEVQIPPETWKELTVEKAFFVRHYFEFCHQKNLYDKIEQYLPELMRLAFLLDQYLKLRQSLLDKNAEITQEHLVFEKKSIKYDRLIEKGVMEIRDLTRRLDRETSDVAQLRLRQDELRSQISENKSQTHTLRSEMRRKPELKDANSQKINHLHLDIKDSMSQVESNSASIMESLDVIEQIEAELSNSKRAQSHRTDERDAFLDSSLDFLERYAPFEEQLMDLDFVIEQLLSIIKSCDSADVAGMRRIMPIVTKAMTNSALNDKNLKLCVEILRKGSDDENYFSQLCTEIITDIRDSVLDENDETFMSAHDLFGFDSHNDENESALDGDNEDSANDQQSVITDASQDVSQDSSKRRKVGPVMPPDHILIQCLTVLQYYLEIAEDTRANSHQLDTLIDTLIRPALTNNENAKIRLLGYRTLGLFTLIDEGLGISNLKFFGISASKAHDEDLKILCMNTIFDILFTHGVGILDAEGKDAVDSLSLARLFYSLIKLHDMPKLQATVAEGLCKLFLADLLVDFGKGQADDDEDTEISQEDHLLEVLLFSYFHPLNAQNQDLRQTLAFCIPVYCFSHEKHQLKVSSISADCFYRIFKNEGEFEKFGASLSPTNVLQQLIYWCDPHNIVNITQEALQTNMSHFWQAIKLLQIVEQDSPRNVKKAVIQNLNKLSLSESLGQDVLRGLLNAIDDTKKVILDNQSKAEFVLDASCDRALEKFNSYVEDLLQIAEKLDASSSNTQDPRAMALSVSGEIPSAEDVASGEIPLAEDVVKDEIPHVGDTDTNDIPLAEELDTHANDILLDTGSPEKPQAQTVPKQSDQIADLVASELADIDKMLEDEDEVEYDIDGIDM